MKTSTRRLFSLSVNDSEYCNDNQDKIELVKCFRNDMKCKEPLFVIDTDVNENVIYTGEGKNHPGLYRNVLFVSNEEIHWIRTDLALKNNEFLSVLARIRYRQKLEKATIHKVEAGLYVEFEQMQSAITEGQFVAWYINDELLGSGVIS